MNSFKQIICSLVIFTIIFGSVNFSVKNVQAVAPTFEDNPLVIAGSIDSSINLPLIAGASAETGIATAEGAAAGTGHFLEQVYQWAKDVLIMSLKKALLNYLTDRVIAYIQGNSNGGFIGDWQGYMSGVVASELQQYAKKLSGVDICAPFQNQIKLAFALPPVKKFGYNITCTFDEIGVNMEDFVSDFKNGSWLAYEKMWEPNNNGYGVFLTASIEQAATIMASGEAAKAEVQAGAGILSKKVCEEDTSFQGYDGDLDGQPDSYSVDTTADIDGDGTPGDIPSSCKILTPGTVVAQAVKKAAVDADFDFVLAGEDLTPYVAAIADAMVGRVLTEGLSLVSTIGDTSDIGNYVDTSAIERSEVQQFRTHRTRLSKRVNEALQLRESAQLTIESASSTWLKNMNGEEDPAKAALDQVKLAKQVLLYTHNEMNKVTLPSQLKNKNNPSCEVVNSIRKLDNITLPKLRKLINNANDLIDVLNIAYDDLPDLDPDFENPCAPAKDESLSDTTDITCEDNKDQVAILKYAQNAIDTELIENTEETRAKLLNLNSLIGDDALSSAREFKNSARKIDKQLSDLFRATSSYASRLKACFVPRDPADPTQPITPGTQGVVIPWLFPIDDGNEDAGKPPRPFIWEMDDTSAQNIDDTATSTPDQVEQAPADQTNSPT